MGNLHIRDFESLWGRLRGASSHFSTSGSAIISLFDLFFSLLCSQKALVMMESEMWDERGVTVNGQTGGRFSDLVDDAHIRLLFLFVAY